MNLVSVIRESISKTITNNDVMTFAELTTDFNPLHVNEEYAKQFLCLKIELLMECLVGVLSQQLLV